MDGHSDMEWVHFSETPPMSTYTLALSVSTLHCQPCQKAVSGGVDFRVCAQADLVERGMADYACAKAPGILAHLESLMVII